MSIISNTLFKMVVYILYYSYLKNIITLLEHSMLLNLFNFQGGLDKKVISEPVKKVMRTWIVGVFMGNIPAVSKSLRLLFSCINLRLSHSFRGRTCEIKRASIKWFLEQEIFKFATCKVKLIPVFLDDRAVLQIRFDLYITGKLAVCKQVLMPW